MLAFFKIPPLRQATLLSVRGADALIIKNGEQLRKKGGIFMFPQNNHFILYLRFDGDSDSAIKHDLIP